MATSKEELEAKIKRLNVAGSKAETFIAAGGNFGSKEGFAIGSELLHAFNDLSTELGDPPILKKIEAK
jgi:hypothetical protein